MALTGVVAKALGSLQSFFFFTQRVFIVHLLLSDNGLGSGDIVVSNTDKVLENIGITY